MSASAPGVTPLARLLLVDDNALERFMAGEALRQAGYEVVEAEDGEQGLRAFERERPDLVLLDVKMPVLDGFAACKALRHLDAGDHVPVLMLTGLDDVDSINQAYEAGATDFHVKPINGAVLLHRVRYLLRAKQTADDLRRSQAQLVHAQRLAGLGYWEWSESAVQRRYSREVEQILGAAPDIADEARSVLRGNVHVDDRARFDAAIESLLHGESTATVEHRIVRPDGAERIVRQELEAVRDGDASPLRIVGALQDITERRTAEERIRHLAYYDHVTGLPNRTLLGEHLAAAIARAQRRDRLAAVLFLDLDHFKRVNDTLGHSAGDELLRLVGDRLVECTRDEDCVSRETLQHPGQTVSRLGGDEFVVLLPEVPGLEAVATVANRIQLALQRPFSLAGSEICISPSIGISAFPQDGRDVDTLLKHADAAMYHAKSEGRDRWRFFTAEMNERVLERLQMEASLRRAVKDGELVLHYQPIVSLEHGEVCGVEALVRWQRSDGSLVSPGDFIPLAEETGLIVPIGEWVARQACRQVAGWRRRGLGDLHVSINVSAAQFSRPGLRQAVADALRDADLDPGCVQLELTETVLMGDVDTSARSLTALKSLGVRIAIDDFGTGYSSLAYLKRFPIDALKIDRSFIRDIASDPDDAAIVTATIGLARSLRLDVVAEGVEDVTQLEFLRRHDCGRFQGFLAARPMPAEAFERWLAEGGATALFHTPALEVRQAG